MAFIQSRNSKLTENKPSKLVNSMRANFLFTGLNLNRTIQSEKEVPERAHFMDDALKTRGIIYLNVETWLLFAPLPIKISGYAPGPE